MRRAIGIMLSALVLSLHGGLMAAYTLSPSFPTSNAPRLLQAVEGDFTIQVKVGVAALHATTKPFTAEFAQFQLSTGKP